MPCRIATYPIRPIRMPSHHGMAATCSKPLFVRLAISLPLSDPWRGHRTANHRAGKPAGQGGASVRNGLIPAREAKLPSASLSNLARGDEGAAIGVVGVARKTCGLAPGAWGLAVSRPEALCTEFEGLRERIKASCGKPGALRAESGSSALRVRHPCDRGYGARAQGLEPCARMPRRFSGLWRERAPVRRWGRCGSCSAWRAWARPDNSGCSSFGSCRGDRNAAASRG